MRKIAHLTLTFAIFLSTVTFFEVPVANALPTGCPTTWSADELVEVSTLTQGSGRSKSITLSQDEKFSTVIDWSLEFSKNGADWEKPNKNTLYGLDGSIKGSLDGKTLSFIQNPFDIFLFDRLYFRYMVVIEKQGCEKATIYSSKSQYLAKREAFTKYTADEFVKKWPNQFINFKDVDQFKANIEKMKSKIIGINTAREITCAQGRTGRVGLYVFSGGHAFGCPADFPSPFENTGYTDFEKLRIFPFDTSGCDFDRNPEVKTDPVLSASIGNRNGGNEGLWLSTESDCTIGIFAKGIGWELVDTVIFQPSAEARRIAKEFALSAQKQTIIEAEKKSAEKLADEILKQSCLKLFAEVKTFEMELNSSKSKYPKAANAINSLLSQISSIKNCSSFTVNKQQSLLASAKSQFESIIALNQITTIVCIKGKAIKKVTGVRPFCPSGYKKKLN